MMGASFYVYNKADQLVPAQFLVDNGQEVPDPNTANPQNQLIYDIYGNWIANANQKNYLIVPYGYSLDSARSFATNGIGNLSLLNQPGALISAFIRGGSQDLQRNYTDINGNAVSGGPPVLAFQDSSSFGLGVITATAGLPLSTAEIVFLA